MPGKVKSAKTKKTRQSQKLIPREPFYALIWFLTGIRFSEAKLALDRYEGIAKELKNLNPLAESESVKVSSADMEDIGRTLGRLLANHALAGGRPINQLKPDLGDLGRKRQELMVTSKDGLQLLDTILQGFTTKPATQK